MSTIISLTFLTFLQYKVHSVKNEICCQNLIFVKFFIKIILRLQNNYVLYILNIFLSQLTLTNKNFSYYLQMESLK